VRRFLVKANVVPNSPILITLMKEALSSSETSVLSRAALHTIPQDTILHNSMTVSVRRIYGNMFIMIYIDDFAVLIL
jgi:hypothetical protein